MGRTFHGEQDYASHRSPRALRTLVAQSALARPLLGPVLGRFLPILPIFRTFLGDFNPQKLPSRRLQTPWEQKNRVLLEEYYIFSVAIPLEWATSWKSVKIGLVRALELLSFDLQRNCYIRNVVLFEENSILLLPGWSEAPQQPPGCCLNPW